MSASNLSAWRWVKLNAEISFSRSRSFSWASSRGLSSLLLAWETKQSLSSRAACSFLPKSHKVISARWDLLWLYRQLKSKFTDTKICALVSAIWVWAKVKLRKPDWATCRAPRRGCWARRSRRSVAARPPSEAGERSSRLWASWGESAAGSGVQSTAIAPSASPPLPSQRTPTSHE